MQDSSTSNGKQKVSRTGPLTQEEIATEAAAMVYRIITSTLSRSRQASKLQLYNDVLHLFVSWSAQESKVDQKTLRINW